jgi:SAM-dependent methyltransferase
MRQAPSLGASEPTVHRVSRLTRLRALKWPTIAYEVQKNLVSRARGRCGELRAITSVGASLDKPEQRVGYSHNAFEGVLENGSLDRAELAGLRVLELGPGEDLCVALRFLAAGAARVSCVDRFSFHTPPKWERDVYRLLLADVGDDGRKRLAGIVSPGGELRADGERLEVVRGVGIEEGAERLSHRRFDLILSVAVLEHVYDIAASLRAMDALLVAGGLMVHQVDLRDHGMFSSGGRHPLEFLTIDDRVYRLMSSHTGAPNRERIGVYRELLAGLGHEATIKVTNVGGGRKDLAPYRERIAVGSEVDPALAASIGRMRGRLAPRFAPLPVEELATTGILVRSRKPPAAA